MDFSKVRIEDFIGEMSQRELEFKTKIREDQIKESRVDQSGGKDKYSFKCSNGPESQTPRQNW